MTDLRWDAEYIKLLSPQKKLQGKGSTSYKKNVFFRALPKLPLPLPPIWANCTTFLDVKNDVLARITEPCNNDYDNDGSNNCDYNFGTFDNFGVKNDQKVSYNMILMSRYMGQLHSGRGPKYSGKAPPSPSSGNARKKTCSLSQRESSCKNLFELFLVPLPPN